MISITFNNLGINSVLENLFFFEVSMEEKWHGSVAWKEIWVFFFNKFFATRKKSFEVRIIFEEIFEALEERTIFEKIQHFFLARKIFFWRQKSFFFPYWICKIFFASLKFFIFGLGIQDLFSWKVMKNDVSVFLQRWGIKFPQKNLRPDFFLTLV